LQTHIICNYVTKVNKVKAGGGEDAKGLEQNWHKKWGTKKVIIRWGFKVKKSNANTWYTKQVDKYATKQFNLITFPSHCKKHVFILQFGWNMQYNSVQYVMSW
jgi:hypothetical protein